MLLAAASLLFFLAVAVLDHWVFQHGLSFIARLGLFALWVAGAGVFVWRFLVPPLANRINPVFAAQTIEQGRPTLKNSLINFLLLRSHPQDVAPVVYRAMEHRAAADLLKVPVDHAVDRGRIVHLACVLAARGRGLRPLPGPLAQEPAGLGGAGALALVERPGAHAGPHRRSQSGRQDRVQRRPRADLRRRSPASATAKRWPSWSARPTARSSTIASS